MLYVCEIFSMVWYDYYMVLWVPKLNRRNEKKSIFLSEITETIDFLFATSLWSRSPFNCETFSSCDLMDNALKSPPVYEFAGQELNPRK